MPAEADGKFIKAPLAPAETGGEAPQSMTAAATDFIENDAFPMIVVAVVVLFLAYQFGRWALSFRGRRGEGNDVDDFDDLDEADEAPSPPKPVNLDRTPWRTQQADSQSSA